MSILVQRYLGRSRFFQELVEDWQLHHREAMLALDLEELIPECLDLARLSRRTWDWLLECLFDDKHKCDRVFASEGLVKDAIHRTVYLFKNVGLFISKSEKNGFLVEGANEFRQALADMERLEKETEDPSIDSRLIDESLAAYQRGEYQTRGTSSMDYKVKVPKPISEKIGSFGLHRNLMVRLVTAIHTDIPRDYEHSRQFRVQGKEDLYRYRKLLVDEKLKHLFRFVVDDTTAQGFLIIRSIRHDTRPNPQ